MKDEERICKEITINTQKILLFHFDQLLLGLDTHKGKFVNEKEKQNKIKAIKNYVKYRVNEKIIDPNTELWAIVKEIEKADLEDKESNKKFLYRLIKMHYSYLDLKSINLRSKQGSSICNYYRQNVKEMDKVRGEEVINRFFKMFENKKP